MAYKPTSIDITMMVFGILMMVLTISLFGVAGAMVDVTSSFSAETSQLMNYLQMGVAAWYLVTSIFAIASGATGNKCPYVTVIILSIMAVFVSIGGSALAVLYVYTSVLDGWVYVSERSFGIYPNYQDLVGAVRDAAFGLPEGVMIINFLSFIFMIVISCLGCCGTCCNTTTSPPEPMQHTTFVTSGGFGYAQMAPPSYVSYPPPSQPIGYTGIVNPNYSNNEIAMNSYKA